MILSLIQIYIRMKYQCSYNCKCNCEGFKTKNAAEFFSKCTFPDILNNGKHSDRLNILSTMRIALHFFFSGRLLIFTIFFIIFSSSAGQPQAQFTCLSSLYYRPEATMAALMSQVLIIHEIHYVIHKHNVMRQAMRVGNNIKVLSAPTCILLPSSCGECYNIGTSKTHLKLNFCHILFSHHSFISCQIVFKFCTKHGSDTAMLCAKFQNKLKSKIDVMNEQVFVKFEFNPSGAETSVFWMTRAIQYQVANDLGLHPHIISSHGIDNAG